jgi:hypothetical protein
MAPARWPTRRPPENTRKLGMLSTEKRWARFGLCSVFTLSTSALPARRSAAFATSGAATRHGPHQSAQKSTRTGTAAVETISSNAASSTSMGVEDGSIAALQLPQRPRCARWRGGTRFSRPQAEQRRIIEKQGVHVRAIVKPHRRRNKSLNQHPGAVRRSRSGSFSAVASRQRQRSSLGTLASTCSTCAPHPA